MTKKRRAPGTACFYGKRCIAVCVVGGHRACAKHAADVVFADVVRGSLGGACWAAGRHTVRCNGNIQCAHIMSRRYKAIRWSPDNAVPLCGAHHTYFTHSPLEWQDACIRWGVDYDALRRRALNDPPVDPADYLARMGLYIPTKESI